MPLSINIKAKTRLRNPNKSLAELAPVEASSANDLFCIFRTDVLCFPAVFLDSKHGETKSAD
ncbi:MAG: hypothetical protein ABI180_00475 [Microcoleus sp.]|jgi:hypothetical protein